jgi:uncharacterized protein (DUF58 family)
MTEGLVVELDELLMLKRYALTMRHRPLGRRIQGLNVSRFRGSGMNFSDTRNYQAGDEIRHMEWRVTARTGRPHVKVYQQERERPVILLLDFNPSMYFGTRIAYKSVIAARLAALIAWTTVKQDDRIGALFYGSDGHKAFMPSKRELALLPMLATLSHYTKKINHEGPQHALPLSNALLRLHRVLRPGSLLVVISDFYQMDNECEKQFIRLKAHNDIIAYHVADTLELVPPKPGMYALTNGQQTLLLDTNDKTIWQAYQNWCNDYQTTIQSQLTRLCIPYHLVSADDDLPMCVYQTFPRRHCG